MPNLDRGCYRTQTSRLWVGGVRDTDLRRPKDEDTQYSCMRQRQLTLKNQMIQGLADPRPRIRILVGVLV